MLGPTRVRSDGVAVTQARLGTQHNKIPMKLHAMRFKTKWENYALNPIRWLNSYSPVYILYTTLFSPLIVYAVVNSLLRYAGGILRSHGSSQHHRKSKEPTKWAIIEISHQLLDLLHLKCFLLIDIFPSPFGISSTRRFVVEFVKIFCPTRIQRL